MHGLIRIHIINFLQKKTNVIDFLPENLFTGVPSYEWHRSLHARTQMYRCAAPLRCMNECSR